MSPVATHLPQNDPIETLEWRRVHGTLWPEGKEQITMLKPHLAWTLTITSLLTATQVAATESNPASDSACPTEANLLRDVDFAGIRGEGKRIWRPRQHARGNDFRYAAEEDVLTIEKIGKEPWFLLVQRLDQALPAGTELQYDATLALNTREPAHAHEFGYVSGLYLVGKAGRKDVFRFQAEHEPNIGEYPAQQGVTRVTAEADLTRIEVGFIHQSDGSFTIQSPRLIDLGAHPECRLPYRVGAALKTQR